MIDTEESYYDASYVFTGKPQLCGYLRAGQDNGFGELVTSPSEFDDYAMYFAYDGNDCGAVYYNYFYNQI